MHKPVLAEPHQAALTHVKYDKEQHGQDDPLNALDLKLVMVLEREEALQLFLEPGAAQRNLWDDSGDVRDSEYALDISASYQDQMLSISGSGGVESSFHGSRVRLTRGAPRDGGKLELEARARIYPSVKQIGPICNLMKQDVTITLVDDQTEVPADG